MKHSLFGILAIALASLVVGCDNDPDSSVAETQTSPTVESTASIPRRTGGLLDGLDPIEGSPGSSTGEIAVPRLVDVHESAGIEFIHDNGDSPAMLMMQSTSGGVAWLDIDADGWLDLFFPQGGNPFERDADQRPSADQLYRSLSGERFVNVSSLSIPVDQEFGHGVVVGDFDDDGFDDIYVSNVGRDCLLHNLGDGTFEDATIAAGIDNPLWTSSAAWYDLDGDGDLDIYVCNYVDYDPHDPISCLDEDGRARICHPKDVVAVPNKCYINQGDGTFLEEADQRGLNAPGGKSLGLVIADLNDDSLPDLFVANDTTANHLFINQGNGTFVEQGVSMGCAMSGLGQYQASMGVGYGDFDENGFADLYCTHFAGDSNTLYASNGSIGFEDITRKVGLHLPTLPYLAFGAVMSDFDANGRQDLFVANGHIDDWTASGDLYYMPTQLFTYDGANWQECTQDAGAYFQLLHLARGVASADYDHDGDMDLAVVNQNEPAALMRNDSQMGHWLQLSFRGAESNRRGIGVNVTLVQGDRRLVQQLAGGTSYCSGHQPALFFGLGDADLPCEISVTWPSGRTQTLKNVKVDERLMIDERDSVEAR